ncbi:MAG TPA: hypothetical protein VLB80_00105 [Candidatus Babeliales bacterium]|nr:hypothetical protein [Candidatus Babeliales bacterium]
MKKIKTTSYHIVSLIFSIISTGSSVFAAPSLLMGTIQFSKDSTLRPININCAGTEIKTTLHETYASKITFEIPKANDQFHFDVLIMYAKIDSQPKKFPNGLEIPNTPDYLKIDIDIPYVYYSIDFINNIWVIAEKKLPENRQIPDRAIIIECYPEWITDFKGGSAVEIPTLFINNAIIGGEEAKEIIEEALIKLELTALDSRIFHKPMHRQTQVAPDKKRILIMDQVV